MRAPASSTSSLALSTALFALALSLGCGPSSPSQDASTNPDTLSAHDKACLLTAASIGAACDFEASCLEPQRCCGLTSEGSGCGCENGRVFCVFDDTCHFTQCSPGCGPDQFTTSAGCTACAAIDDLVQSRLEAAAVAAGTCEVDSDCALMPVSTMCGRYCHLAVPRLGEITFQQLASKISGEDCSEASELECRTSGRCDGAEGVARCVDGACRSVRTCDPAHSPVGAACDDRDPCTVDDTCTAAFVCTGQPRDCDDHNLCTADTCQPDGTCLSTPAAAPCDLPEGSCAVGAECQEGACVESEFLGFTRVFPEPWRYALAIATPANVDDAPIFVGGFHDRSFPDSFILALDPRGDAIRTLAPSTVERPSSMVPLGADELLIAGESVAMKTDIHVARLAGNGVERWKISFATGSDARAAQLALSPGRTGGTSEDALAALVWLDLGDLGQGIPRVALFDLDGHVRHEAPLSHWPVLYREGAPTVTTLAATDASDGAVFATAHTRTDLDTDHAEVVLTRLAADGRVVAQTPITTDRDEDARGLLGLPDGGLLVWGVKLTETSTRPGSRDGAGWVRRLAPSGETRFELALNVVAAFVREDHLELVGADPIAGADFEVGTRAWLAHLDLDALAGPSLTRWDLPPGPALTAVAPLANGVAMLANLWDRDPLLNPLSDGSNAAIWVRRAALALPGCDPRP